MNILAIETSLGRTSTALCIGRKGGAGLVRRLEPGTSQAEHLIPLIAALMAEAGESFSALDRIAVSIGPGGFSGVRTGVAAARGIGLAAGVPVAGATSFRIMAEAFEMQWRDDVPSTYGLAAPAGQSAVFCQLLRWGCLPVTEIAALPHAELGAFFESATVLSGPSASPLYDGGFVSIPVRFPDLAPDASVLAAIAPKLDPARDLPSPYYVRPADARPQDGHVIARKKD